MSNQKSEGKRTEARMKKVFTERRSYRPKPPLSPLGGRGQKPRRLAACSWWDLAVTNSCRPRGSRDRARNAEWDGPGRAEQGLSFHECCRITPENPVLTETLRTALPGLSFLLS